MGRVPESKGASDETESTVLTAATISSQPAAEGEDSPGASGQALSGPSGAHKGRPIVADRYQLIRMPADVYQVSYVPFIVLPQDFAIVVVSAVAICFASTIYPSRQASRLDPVQALRIE